jgi:hypothetical protein
VTTAAITTRRDYLSGNRRMILGRAIAGTVAGAVPLPFLDDWLVRRILGAGYRKIANAHRVDLEDAAVEKLVHGKTSPASWTEIAASGVAYRLASGAWKRVLLALTTVRRARAASKTFVVMTLFEHYCAKLHVGLALDAATALEVRDAIAAAIEATPGGLSFEPFRRGARSAARATLRAPLELADLVSGGRLRKLLERGRDVAEPESVTALDQAIDEALADQSSFLGRAATAVELQLSSEVNPYLDAVIARFDDGWRRRSARP